MGLLLMLEINILLDIEVRMEADFGEAFSTQKTLAQQLAKGSAAADFGLILHVGVSIEVEQPTDWPPLASQRPRTVE